MAGGRLPERIGECPHPPRPAEVGGHHRQRPPTGGDARPTSHRGAVGGPDRTRTERIEKVFAAMGQAEYATSTVDHTWDYLNQACGYARATARPGPSRPRTPFFPRPSRKLTRLQHLA